jgi:hypothetical protein
MLNKRTARIIAEWSTIVLLLVIGFSMQACRKGQITTHPGAVSNLDSYAYDLLLVEQDAINEARNQFSAGKLPADAKGPLQAAIGQYNTTVSVWQDYHANHNKSDSALQDALTALVDVVGNLQKSLGKTSVQGVTH